MLRYFNAAGADPEAELVECHDPETHLVPLAIDAATGRGPALQIFGTDYPTADGTCERDFIHVSDLASAHVAALRHLKANNSSLTLNLGTGKATSIRNVISVVGRVTGHAVPVVHAARRPGDPPVLVADASRARDLIGFQPRASDIDTIVATAWQARMRAGLAAARPIARDDG
jgi:UDP-glucose 4-epimerase